MKQILTTGIIVLLAGLLFASPAFSQAVVLDSTRTHCGGNYPTVKYALSAGLSDDATVVAAVTGKKIRVLSYQIGNNGGTGEGTVFFRTAAGGAQISAVMSLAPATDPASFYSVNCGYTGCFETDAGALLQVDIDETAATVGVSIALTYIECG